jgi:hypothetical protein
MARNSLATMRSGFVMPFGDTAGPLDLKPA